MDSHPHHTLIEIIQLLRNYNLLLNSTLMKRLDNTLHSIMVSITGFQHEERFIYVGSSGLLVIVVFILITYICFKKKRRKIELDTANPKERDQCSNLDKHLVHGMKDETNTDENDYDEIDDSFLSDIKMSRDDKYDLDSVEDGERSQSIEENINGVEIDVHQYKSMKNEEEISTTSDENLRDSGYLHPYQPFVTNLTEVKHEYIGIKHLHTGCTGTQTKGRQGDNDE
ncbi:unnamed protein product [Mytilus coruscus]|uniref:Uncharacterized protein n=1 Tax=Mytilus coruscus TaxID=42192 RepID=A0A6J8BRT5_MYTCO|nr:unnamed protein product [Mytilus coruscus]